MSLAKFLVNTVIIGAVAGGVYHYLDQNAKSNAANAEDPETAPTALDPENIKDAANRAYTTIQHGTEEAAGNFKKAIGPQGEELLNNVQDAGLKIKDAAVDTGKRIGDIVANEDADTATKATAVYDAVVGAATDLKGQLSKNGESVADVAGEFACEVKEDIEKEVSEVEDGVAHFEEELKEEIPASDVAAAEAPAAEDVADAAQNAADAVAEEVEAVKAEIPDADKIEEFFDEDAQ